MDWLTTHWKDVLEVLAYIVAGASVVVKLTPTPKDDAILAKIVGLLNVMALNPKK